MAELIQFLIRPFWQLLMPIPMPWRSAIIIPLFIVIFSWIFLRVVPWLITQILQILIYIELPHLLIKLAQFLAKLFLLPSYLATQIVSRRDSRFMLFINIFDSAISGIVNVVQRICQILDKIIKKGSHTLNYFLKKRWFPNLSLLLIAPIFWGFIWYIRPQVIDNEVTKIIDSTILSWESIENWATHKNLKALSPNNNPQQFIRDYFSGINDQHYTFAWNSLSSNFKNKAGNYKKFREWWGNQVEKVELHEVSVKSQNKKNATVNVNMQYLMRNTKKMSKTDSIRFHLIWHSQDNRWLIDNSEDLSSRRSNS
jgi:hypothetical protein